MAHASLERQLVAAQTNKVELETKVRERDLTIERLERDRRWFADREKEEKDEKEQERAEHEEYKVIIHTFIINALIHVALQKKTDAELRSLRASLTTLREQHADLEDTHSTLSRTSTQQLASQKSQITTLTRQSALLTDEISQLRQIADSRSRALDELQERYDELANNQDTYSRKNTEEERESMAVVREELHRQAAYHRTLESTNAKLTGELNILRDRHASVEVLREEKRGLERKVKVLDELRDKVVRLEAEVEAGRREREEWFVYLCCFFSLLRLIQFPGRTKPPKMFQRLRKPQFQSLKACPNSGLLMRGSSRNTARLSSSSAGANLN